MTASTMSLYRLPGLIDGSVKVRRTQPARFLLQAGG